MKLRNKKLANPFIYQGYESPEYFCDREVETKTLMSHLKNGRNVTLISPRRLGKTGLIKNTFYHLEKDEKDSACLYLDIFATKNLHDFVEQFGVMVINDIVRKNTSFIEKTIAFFSALRPVLSMDPLTGEPSVSVTIEPSQEDITIRSIFNYLNESGKEVYIAIDEFQQIGDFPDSLTFQKKLRSVWQLQSHVSYCLYGSKKHMMEQMFQNASYPFYRFGDFFYLNKISEKDWVEYICQRFESTGKHISEELAREICQVTDRYSSYVQQLAWFVWLRVQDDSAATEEDLKYGIDRLLDACEPLFIQQTEDLSAYQMNFLHAIINGVHTGFTQTAILETYRLGTAANVTRLKKSLMVKDLITIPAPKHLEMSDPILALWLKRRVWK